MIDFYDGPDFAVRMLHSYHRVMDTVESIYEKPNRCGACLKFYPYNFGEDTIIGNLHDNPELLKGGKK